MMHRSVAGCPRLPAVWVNLELESPLVLRPGFFWLPIRGTIGDQW